MRPLGKLGVESDRLRGRIEAIERLAAESRVAAEAQREDEQRVFGALVDSVPDRAESDGHDLLTSQDRAMAVLFLFFLLGDRHVVGEDHGKAGDRGHERDHRGRTDSV